MQGVCVIYSIAREVLYLLCTVHSFSAKQRFLILQQRDTTSQLQSNMACMNGTHAQKPRKSDYFTPFSVDFYNVTTSARLDNVAVSELRELHGCCRCSVSSIGVNISLQLAASSSRLESCTRRDPGVFFVKCSTQLECQ